METSPKIKGKSPLRGLKRVNSRFWWQQMSLPEVSIFQMWTWLSRLSHQRTRKHTSIDRVERLVQANQALASLFI